MKVNELYWNNLWPFLFEDLINSKSVHRAHMQTCKREVWRLKLRLWRASWTGELFQSLAKTSYRASAGNCGHIWPGIDRSQSGCTGGPADARYRAMIWQPTTKTVEQVLESGDSNSEVTPAGYLTGSRWGSDPGAAGMSRDPDGAAQRCEYCDTTCSWAE